MQKKSSIFTGIPIPIHKKRFSGTYHSLGFAGILFLVIIIGATLYMHGHHVAYTTLGAHTNHK